LTADLVMALRPRFFASWAFMGFTARESAAMAISNRTLFMRWGVEVKIRLKA